jgi:ornithine--oxo-acid transaminase
MAALRVITDENLCANALYLGRYLRQELSKIQHPLIGEIRGQGLLSAIVIKTEDPGLAYKICLEFMHNGLLAKPTHDYIIRLAPPLVINKEQIEECVEIIGRSIKKF